MRDQPGFGGWKAGFGCIVAALWAHAAAAGDVPAFISGALADPSRPAADLQRDPARKPAEVIAFSGIKPGDVVADFMPGNGYFARIFCKVVGDTGRVYAITVPRTAPGNSPNASEPSVKPAGDSSVDACANVIAITLEGKNRSAPELWSSSDDPGMVYEYLSFSPAAENFATPEPLDAIWISGHYHDLHTKHFGAPNMQRVNRDLLKALKPGGILLIEDHAAARGAGTRDTDTLHRIEARQVKSEVIAAGFEFVAESKLLRNARDAHTASAHELLDETDRFLLKFRKP
jgi:predicted methyltransferase